MSRITFLITIVFVLHLVKGSSVGITTNCPTGYQGANCDECGKVFASQNVKIVGGVTATPNSWPSIAYLEFNYRQNYRLPTGITVQATFGSACGGTLIDRQTVLTAAHCIQRTGQFTYQGATYTGDITPNAEYPTYGSMYTVYLGLHDKSALNAAPSVAMNVSSIRVHELYASSSYDNDIALLYLSKSATLSNYIQIACLPTASSSYYPGSSKICYAAGWGTLSSGGVTPDLLNNVRITTYPATSCSNVATLTSGQICAGLYSGGKDTCQGDSGGPLYNSDTVNSQNKFVVSGIVSYGKGCGDATYPSVYTRVSYYLNWINNQTSSSSDLLRISSSLIYISVMILPFFSA